MTFIPAALIRKKRDGGRHDQKEIQFLIREFTQNRIPDYQMAAWLMAVCWRGLSMEETVWLTQEMRDSGVVLDLSRFPSPVDKHSTGGIGDKTSLIIAPLVAAAGVPVPMMAGRALAFTGGTLDKLESIPGFQVQLSTERFIKQLETVGTAIIGQSEEICPADRKLYALRDVTGTVESIPLICGSILSKKLAEGISALVLDVKFGSGAFMKTLPEAEALARSLKEVGEGFGKKIAVFLTRMDEPLGRFVGNVLEVRECLDILKGHKSSAPGKDYSDTLELSLELSAHMIHLGGKSQNLEEARLLARDLVNNGSALRKFEELCQAQNGRLPESFPVAKKVHTITAKRDGYFRFTDLERVGNACIHLGAGRRLKGDPIDHAAGIEVYCQNGAPVKTGDRLMDIHYNLDHGLNLALNEIENSYVIEHQPSAAAPLIAKVIT